MKRLLLLALLLLVSPTWGQEAVTLSAPVGASGTITNVGDFIVAPISGGQWATAYWYVLAGGGGAQQPIVTYSFDGGTNFYAAPYTKRIDNLSPNPAVNAYAGSNGIAVGFIGEVPLPGDCTHLKIAANINAAAATISITGGKPYVFGDPVSATLYNFTQVGAIANTTGVLVTTGWSSAMLLCQPGPTTGTCSFSVYDGPSGGAYLTQSTVTAGALMQGQLGPGQTSTGSNWNVGGSQMLLPRRFVLGTDTTANSTVRVEVFR